MKKTYTSNIINKHKDKKGFTLIELLVVISIIALLSSVVLTSLSSARKKGLDSKTIQEIAQIRNQLEIYALDNGGTYPTVTYNGPSHQYAILNKESDVNFLDTFSDIFSKTAYAANGDCIRDSTGPSPDWDKIKKMDTNPPENCIKYFSTGNTAAIFSDLKADALTATDGTEYYKKYGAVFGIKTNSQLNDLCSSSQLYPAFGVTSDGHIVCTGGSGSALPFDAVLGITGGGTMNFVHSGGGVCSDPQYTDEPNCTTDHSYCDDSTGRSPGEYCENECDDTGGTEQPSYTTYSACVDSVTHNEYCIDEVTSDVHSEYSSLESCQGAGVCSDTGYGDQSSCEGAYHCIDSNGYDQSYSNSDDCTSATYTVTDPYCYDQSGTTVGGYGDSDSCTSAGECSDTSYSDQTNCENNGNQWNGYNYQWNPGETANAGYSWVTYGYSWTGYGYTWHVSDDPNGYVWNRRSSYPNWVAVPINTWTPDR